MPIFQSPFIRRLLIGLAVVLVTAGCSSSSDSSDTVRVAKIGVVAPLDAGLVQFGRGIRNAVQVAVNEANQGKAVPG